MARGRDERRRLCARAGRAGDRAMKTRPLLRLAAIVAACSFVELALERDARADRRSEAAAKDAIARADDDYLQSNFDKALKRLQAAERVCGEASCTAPTHAALLRDIGTMELRLGTPDAA